MQLGTFTEVITTSFEWFQIVLILVTYLPTFWLYPAGIDNELFLYSGKYFESFLQTSSPREVI